MSKEVKRYDCELPVFYSDGGVSSETTRMVKASDYEALLAERDAYKKDAERYRWLRDKAMESGDVAPAVLMVDGACKPAFDEPGYGHVSARSGATLDAAIDRALQGAQP